MGVADVQSIGPKATENELLTKFCKDVLKILENLQEDFSNEVVFR